MLKFSDQIEDIWTNDFLMMELLVSCYILLAMLMFVAVNVVIICQDHVSDYCPHNQHRLKRLWCWIETLLRCFRWTLCTCQANLMLKLNKFSPTDACCISRVWFLNINHLSIKWLSLRLQQISNIMTWAMWGAHTMLCNTNC